MPLPARIRLESPTSIYAALPQNGGSATNSGLNANEPMTVERALDAIKNDYDHSGKLMTLRLADGDYGMLPQISGHWTGHHGIEIWGNPNARTLVKIRLYVTDFARVVVRHVMCNDPTFAAVLVKAEQHATIGLANVYLGHAATRVQASDAKVRFNAPCWFGGNCSVSLQAGANGLIELNGNEYTIDGSNVFQVFAQAARNSTILVNPGASFIGSGAGGASAGKRYQAVAGGVIETFGQGETFFPGNQQGEKDATSYYG